MPTTGVAVPVAAPWKGAPKEKIPPSAATIR